MCITRPIKAGFSLENEIASLLSTSDLCAHRCVKLQVLFRNMGEREDIPVFKEFKTQVILRSSFRAESHTSERWEKWGLEREITFPRLHRQGIELLRWKPGQNWSPNASLFSAILSQHPCWDRTNTDANVSIGQAVFLSTRLLPWDSWEAPLLGPFF